MSKQAGLSGPLSLHPCRWGLALFLSTVSIFLSSCASNPKPPRGQAPTPTTDYRNGWYHRASGKESVQAIAQTYNRDPGLIAELNRTTKEAIPAKDKPLYIPPTQDRIALREILERINKNPASVPQTPPSPQSAGALTAPVPASAKPNPFRDDRNAPPPTPPPVKEPNGSPKGQDLPASRKSSPAKTAPQAPQIAQQSSPQTAPVQPGSSGNPKVIHPANPPSVSSTDAAMKRTSPAAPPFVWPVQGKILQGFNDQPVSPFRGITIEAGDRTPVVAAREGTVVYADELKGYGKVVIVEHDRGFLTVYGYNSALVVHKNDKVKAGKTIAMVGRPPASNAPPQLFFQIRSNAHPVDPAFFLH